MRLHRFYIEQKIGQSSEITISDPELIHQLVKVFRFGVGQHVILFDGSGLEYDCEILSLSKKNIVVKILERKSLLARPQGEAASVSLYLSLIKKGNFELAVEKCTEIGVTEIHPVSSERSEKKGINSERLLKIVKEASEQSGRVTLPTVFDLADLEKAVEQAVVEGRKCVVFHTDADMILSNQSLIKSEEKNTKVAVFVGPEGGWTEKEMNLFRENNFKIQSLGQNTLRAETAAIVATYSFML
jgi:16S rRNA (uracil1498-N3)-methyltransferase